MQTVYNEKRANAKSVGSLFLLKEKISIFGVVVTTLGCANILCFLLHFFALYATIPLIKNI